MEVQTGTMTPEHSLVVSCTGEHTHGIGLRKPLSRGIPKRMNMYVHKRTYGRMYTEAPIAKDTTNKHREACQQLNQHHDFCPLAQWIIRQQREYANATTHNHID